MKKPDRPSPETDLLRQKAEELLRNKHLEEVSSVNNDDTKKILYELQVHECELELQKEELEQALEQTASATKLYDLAPTGFFTLSREGLIWQLNLAAAKLLGKERSALLNNSFLHFIDKQTLDVYNNFIRNVFESGEKQSCEVRLSLYETPSAFVYLEGHISGDKQKCLISAVDITERKQTEKIILESENRLNRAELVSKTGNWELHLDTKMMTGSEGAQNIYGVEKHQFEYEVIKNIPLPEYRPMMDAALKNLIEEGKPYNLEFKIKTADTREIKDIHSTAIFDKEKRILFGVIQDITESKRAQFELIKAKENAETSRNYYETIINNMGDPVFVKDNQSRLLLVNDAFCTIFDLSRADIIGKTLTEDVSPDERESFLRIDKQVLTDGLENINEESLTVRDGQTRTISTRKSRFIDIKGDKYLIGVIRDISERHLAEKELKESEIKFRNLFENSPVGKSITGIDGTLHVNKSFCDILGYSEEELKTKKWSEISYEEDIEKTNSILGDLKVGKIKQARFEKRYIHKNGSIVWADVSTYLQQNQEDKPQYFITSINNITEQKLAEEELRESEEHLRITLNSIGDGVITTDSIGMVRQMNPIAEQLTGWAEKEALGKSLEEVFPIINEDTRAVVEIPVRRVLREGIVVGLANHTLLIAKDGTERPIADSGAPIRNKQGEIIGVVLVFRDQSEDRKAEYTLKESEKRFKLLYENAPLSYQSLDAQARFIDVNPTWLATLGYTREEVIGRSFGDFMTPESAELIKNRFARFVTEGEIHDYQFEMIRKDGTHFIVSYEGRIGYDELGHIKQTHCIFTDITDRKRAEEALGKLRLQMEMILNSAGEGIFGLDMHGKITFVNPAAARMIGWSVEELPGKNQHEISHHTKPDGTHYPENECKIQASIKDGKSQKVTEEIFWHKDGTSFPVEYTSTPMQDEKGKLAGAVVTFSDITERKKAIEELRESEYFFRESQNAAFVGSYKFDLVTGFWESSEVLDKIFGIGKEYVRDLMGWEKLIHPGDQEMMDRYLKEEVIGMRKPFNREYRVINKSNGNICWVNGLGQLQFDNSGNILSMIGTIQDITERRQAADTLRNSEEAYRQISDTVSDYIFSSDIDKNGKLTLNWVAGAFEKITGYNYEEYLTCGGWHARLHPDDTEIDDRDLEKLRSNQRISSEVRTIKKDGSVLWVKVYANPVMNQDETELIGINGAVQDINERKLAEEELLRLKNELEFTVAEKTKELKERVSELERFYDATIDREFRMKELRDEIELLKSGK